MNEAERAAAIKRAKAKRSYIVNYRAQPCTSAGVIVCSRDGKYLMVFGLIHEKWRFPKGHIEENERLFQCAKRELKEETNTDIQGLKLKRIQRINKCAYYVMQVVDDEFYASVNDTGEIGAIKWMTIKDLINAPKNNHVSTFIRLMIHMSHR